MVNKDALNKKHLVKLIDDHNIIGIIGYLADHLTTGGNSFPLHDRFGTALINTGKVLKVAASILKDYYA